MNAADREALVALELRIRTILPSEYQDAYEDVQPTSMGSAGLKYTVHGKVAWDDMWATFCDLAMAGGPPHKGSLLEPGLTEDALTHNKQYQAVADEICRGITMVTYMVAEPSPVPGWVRVTCFSDAMADWLLRAIVMENVSTRRHGVTLDLPAAPGFRLEKEIKNVITAVAKTCHYWTGHTSATQQREIGDFLTALGHEWPLQTPGWSGTGRRDAGDAPLYAQIANDIHRDTGLQVSAHGYDGWLGVDCPNVRAAIWMTRALVASNVLSRREGAAVFLPVNPAEAGAHEPLVRTFVHIYRLTRLRGFI